MGLNLEYGENMGLYMEYERDMGLHNYIEFSGDMGLKCESINET